MSEEDRIHHSVGGPQANLLHTLPRDYDMYDLPQDLQRWPKLAPVLRDLEVIVGAAYHRADPNARIYAYRYELLAYIAAISLAVLQLSMVMVEMPWWGRLGGDSVAAIAAVVAVFALITRRLSSSSRRLLEREKAERCRFVKFGFLISPEAWSDSSNVRQVRLRYHVEDIMALNLHALKRLAESEDMVFEPTSLGAAARIDKATLDQLVDYYREKRLRYQLLYFESQAKLRDFLDELARICSPLFFYLGILAALAYFTYNLIMHHSERDALSNALLLSSACLPVVGVTLDQFRKAKGFRRSTIHFRDASQELKQLMDRLLKEADPQARLEILHKTERHLQAQSRENLLLQLETQFSES